MHDLPPGIPQKDGLRPEHFLLGDEDEPSAQQSDQSERRKVERSGFAAASAPQGAQAALAALNFWPWCLRIANWEVERGEIE